MNQGLLGEKQVCYLCAMQSPPPPAKLVFVEATRKVPPGVGGFHPRQARHTVEMHLRTPVVKIKYFQVGRIEFHCGKKILLI